jgi:uncharacterized membrane protein
MSQFNAHRGLVGLLVTGIGLAHFVFPKAFDPINQLAFPERPRRYTYINGGIETVLGLTMMAPATRGAYKVIGFGYACHMLGNLVRARVSAGR